MKKFYFLFILNIIIFFYLGSNFIPDFPFKFFVIGLVSFPLAGISSDLILRLLKMKPPKSND
jgi:hypothetical protein